MTNLPIVIKRVAIALGHLAMATMGVAVTTVSAFFLLKPILLPFVSRTSLDLNLPLRLPLFPLQAVLGFVVGYVWASKQNAFGQDKSARYVWIIPTVWFMLFFISWPHASVLAESRWDHFLWSNAPDSKQLQLVTTLPFLSSITYALGSRCAARPLWGRGR
jgi:hypothetical protein